MLKPLLSQPTHSCGIKRWTFLMMCHHMVPIMCYIKEGYILMSHYISNLLSGRVLKLIKSSSGRFQDFLQHSDSLQTCRFSPSGKLLFTVAYNEILLWEVQDLWGPFWPSNTFSCVLFPRCLVEMGFFCSFIVPYLFISYQVELSFVERFFVDMPHRFIFYVYGFILQFLRDWFVCPVSCHFWQFF